MNPVNNRLGVGHLWKGKDEVGRVGLKEKAEWYPSLAIFTHARSMPAGISVRSEARFPYLASV